MTTSVEDLKQEALALAETLLSETGLLYGPLRKAIAVALLRYGAVALGMDNGLQEAENMHDAADLIEGEKG
jgi:hypothetical protein